MSQADQPPHGSCPQKGVPLGKHLCPAWRTGGSKKQVWRPSASPSLAVSFMAWPWGWKAARERAPHLCSRGGREGITHGAVQFHS